MEQLRRDIESLKAKVEEKEHELLLIQQELSVLQARLDDHISRKKVEEQNAEEQAEMQKRAEEAARLARLKAEALEREAEENKESSMQKTVVSEANDNEIITPDESEVPVVGEAQHLLAVAVVPLHGHFNSDSTITFCKKVESRFVECGFVLI